MYIYKLQIMILSQNNVIYLWIWQNINCLSLLKIYIQYIH